jgi:hypothetical protein
VLACPGQLQEGFGFEPQFLLAAHICDFEEYISFAAPVCMIHNRRAGNDDGLNDFYRTEPFPVIKNFRGAFSRAVFFLAPQIEIL